MSEGTESAAYKRYLAAVRARANPTPIDTRTLGQSRQEAKQQRILQRVGKSLIQRMDSWRAEHARTQQQN